MGLLSQISCALPSDHFTGQHHMARRLGLFKGEVLDKSSISVGSKAHCFQSRAMSTQSRAKRLQLARASKARPFRLRAGPVMQGSLHDSTPGIPSLAPCHRSVTPRSQASHLAIGVWPVAGRDVATAAARQVLVCLHMATINRRIQRGLACMASIGTQRHLHMLRHGCTKPQKGAPAHPHPPYSPCAAHHLCAVRPRAADHLVQVKGCGCRPPGTG